MEGGTGVYYQAMPAVGPDGRNVMKLIPVQKVNGQFFPTVFNTEKDNVQLQMKVRSTPGLSSVSSSSHSQTRLPSLQPIADGRYVLKAPPQVSTLFSLPKSPRDGTKILPKPLNQLHVPPAKPASSRDALQLPPQPNGEPVTVLQKLPVMVKSPILPNGHCLQIPSYAQVRTVPASALPPSIKNQIMNSVSINPANEKQQTVVLVSPVNSVKLNCDEVASSSAKPSQTPMTLPPHLPANTGTSSPVCAPVNPKANEKVSTPIKWVVKESLDTPGPCLVPASSLQMDPIAIQSKHVESVTSTNNIVPQISQERLSKVKDNALVMCNGKVYFVAKKNSEIAKDVMVSEGERKRSQSVSPALPACSALGSSSCKVTNEQDPKIKASEIIDLCDDDEESFTCLGGSPGNLPTQSQTEVEDSSEDCNVIFVSYIPPKSETSAGDKDTNSVSWNKSDGIVYGELEIVEKSVSQIEREETAYTEMEIDVGQGNTVSQREKEQVEESGPAVKNNSVNKDSEKEKQLQNEVSPVGILAETSKIDEAAVEETVRDDLLEQLHDICVPATDYTDQTFEKSAPGFQTFQQKSDFQLKKEFGITSDVRICLQKIRQTKKSETQAERLNINKQTLDGLRKVIQESQLQSKIQRMIQVPLKKTEDHEGLKEVKRRKLQHDVQQNNSSLSTPNILPSAERKDMLQNVSSFPMENVLSSQTSGRPQKEVSYRCNSKEIVESAANKLYMQSEISTDCQTNTPPSEQTQTTGHTTSHPGLRKTSVRLKKGKVCTACPCGTLLGVTETTLSLHPQETQPALFESHKEKRKSCGNKTPEESQPMVSLKSVKKARKKKNISPRKRKSPSALHSIVAPDSSVNMTSSLNASSSNLRESNRVIDLCSEESECNTLSSIHGHSETSEKDTSRMEITSKDTSVSSSNERLDGTIGELPTKDLYSMEVLDAEEIKRQEKIKRLKDLLRDKEAALEKMRRSMNI